MASVKVNCLRVMRACTVYEMEYQRWKMTHKPDKDDDCAWIEKQHKSNNANAVRRIHSMAKMIEETRYPYVILTDKDFGLIGIHLREYGNY